MAQTFPITTILNIDSCQTTLSKKKELSLTEFDEGKKNSTKCFNRHLQVPSWKYSMRFPIKEGFNTIIHQDRSKFACKTKYLDYIGASICPPMFYNLTPIFGCKKSRSMIELSLAGDNSKENEEFGYIRFETNSTFKQTGRLVINTMTTSPFTVETSRSQWNNQMSTDDKKELIQISMKAANLICRTLVLNAWRHRRDEVKELHGTIQQLIQKIDHLQLQNVVLRRLLDTESSRVNKLGAEIQRTKTQLESTTAEKMELTAKIDIVENEIKKLEEVSKERAVISENWKNEVLSTTSQLKAVEAQIERDHEKLKKLREDKKLLFEKVLANETLAAERGERAERSEVIVRGLQNKLEIQTGIINKLQDDKNNLNRALKDAESEKIQLEKYFSVIGESEKVLDLQVSNLTIQLCDREAALRRVESAYNTQLRELDDLKRQLLQQSQQTGWSNRVLQIAGSMMRVTQFILRIFSF